MATGLYFYFHSFVLFAPSRSVCSCHAFTIVRTFNSISNYQSLLFLEIFYIFQTPFNYNFAITVSYYCQFVHIILYHIRRMILFTKHVKQILLTIFLYVNYITTKASLKITGKITGKKQSVWIFSSSSVHNKAPMQRNIPRK